MVAFKEGLRMMGRFELSSLVGYVCVEPSDLGAIVIPERLDDQRQYRLRERLRGSIHEVEEGGYCVFCDAGIESSETTVRSSLGGSGETLGEAFYDLVCAALSCHLAATEIPLDTWDPAAQETVDYWASLFER